LKKYGGNVVLPATFTGFPAKLTTMPAITRRLFNVIAGALSVGSFIMPEESAGAATGSNNSRNKNQPGDDGNQPPAAATAERSLLAAPDRWDWDHAIRTADGAEVVHQYSTFFWTEVVNPGGSGKAPRERVASWTPRSPAEQEEAERFYAATTQINWDDPSINKLAFSSPPRTKTPPRTLDRRIPASLLMPINDVEFSGVSGRVAAWACISGRADRRLPAGPTGSDLVALIEFKLLIHNRSRQPVTLDASRCSLQLTRGEPVAAFAGCGGDPWLAPAFIEQNGQPLQGARKCTAQLLPRGFAVCKVAFPMQVRLRESVAVKLCKSVTLPVDSSPPQQVVLDKS